MILEIPLRAEHISSKGDSEFLLKREFGLVVWFGLGRFGSVCLGWDGLWVAWVGLGWVGSNLGLLWFSVVWWEDGLDRCIINT